jgi:hypothetical protein
VREKEIGDLGVLPDTEDHNFHWSTSQTVRN